MVVGLFVTILLWRNGPFGVLELLYTPTAIIIAQAVIATPIVAGISAGRHAAAAAETCGCRSWPWAPPGSRWSGC